MPAYLRHLEPRLCHECGNRAWVEVFNTWNESLGFRCSPCGKRLLAKLKTRETLGKA